MSVLVREAELSDAHGVARVEIAAWRDTYPALLPSAHLVEGLDMARRTVFWRHRLSHRSALRTVVGAVNSRGPVVGYATWGPCRVDTLAAGGQLFELYLVPDHQGRGLVPIAGASRVGEDGEQQAGENHALHDKPR